VPACALILRVRAAAALLVGGRTWRLDRLTIEHLRACLQDRRTRWPASANPYLLINRSTAGGVKPVSRSYIQETGRRVGITAQDLRADRFLGEAPASGDDPLKAHSSVRDQRPCGRGRRPAYRAPPGSAGPAFPKHVNRERLCFVNRMGGSDAARAFSLP
jgi:hypothetical protein